MGFPRTRNLALALLGLVVTAGLALLLYRSELSSIDWPLFRAASADLLQGQSPYWTRVLIFGRGVYLYNPPWVLLVTAPFAALPERVGWALISAASLVIMLFTARKLGASLPVLIFSAFVVYKGFVVGNVDAFSFAGAVMPPHVGLFFALLKPQNTIGLVLFWAITALQRGGLPQVVRVFWPVTAALALSVAVFGPWFLWDRPFTTDAHMQYFPGGVPYGLVFLGISLLTRKKAHALLASPFLSPYLSQTTVLMAVVWGLVLAQDVIVYLVRVGAQCLFRLRSGSHRLASESGGLG